MWLTEDAIDLEEFTEDELKKQVDLYNNYADDKMTFREVDAWYTLFIDGRTITSDDIYNIIDRIKQINRENGFTHLGE